MELWHDAAGQQAEPWHSLSQNGMISSSLVHVKSDLQEFMEVWMHAIQASSYCLESFGVVMCDDDDMECFAFQKCSQCAP